MEVLPTIITTVVSNIPNTRFKALFSLGFKSTDRAIISDGIAIKIAAISSFGELSKQTKTF